MARFSSLSQQRSWQSVFLWAMVLASVVALFLIATTPFASSSRVLFVDTVYYEQSMKRLFAGEVPYLGFPFEHLPLSIVPMGFAYVISAATGLSYALPFALISILLLFVTGEVVAQTAQQLGIEGAGMRWVWIVAPIVPLVMFRVDALSVLLASSAVMAAMSGREGVSFAAAAGGIMAKGWPVMLGAIDWWRGMRSRAVALVVATLLMSLALVSSAGFRSGRSFSGIHQETVVGSIVTTFRGLVGADIGLVAAAGAVYVDVGRWAVWVTLLIGLAIGVIVLMPLRRPFTWHGGVGMAAGLTFAILLGSPLLSPQFLLWPMPFVAIAGSRSSGIALAVAGGLSVLFAALWQPGLVWWHGMVLIRNGVLILAAGLAARDLSRITSGQP